MFWQLVVTGVNKDKNKKKRMFFRRLDVFEVLNTHNVPLKAFNVINKC